MKIVNTDREIFISQERLEEFQRNFQKRIFAEKEFSFYNNNEGENKTNRYCITKPILQ